MNSPCDRRTQSLQILARVERVGEAHLDLALVVDLHGLGLRDRELVQRRNAPALRAAFLRLSGAPSHFSTSFLFFALARDVAMVKPCWCSPAVQAMGSGLPSSVAVTIFSMRSRSSVSAVIDGAAQAP